MLGWMAPQSGGNFPEGYYANAQLRDGADAVRQLVPRRRRGAYRAGHRCQRPESRGGRCTQSLARLRRLLSRGPPGSPEYLLRQVPSARLGSTAIFVVDDVDAAPFARWFRVRLSSPDCGTGICRQLARGNDQPCRKLRGPASGRIKWSITCKNGQSLARDKR